MLLLAALATALAYFWDPNNALDFNPPEKQSTLAKTYVMNTRTLTYNEQGSLTEILEAAEVQHFAKQKKSFMITPRYYSHNGGDRTWSVTSDRGRFLNKQELLFLEGNVILTDDLNNGHLYTEALQINLERKIATSRVPIKIIQGLNTITAKGMVADLNKEQVRLMPDVESIYAPATP